MSKLLIVNTGDIKSARSLLLDFDATVVTESRFIDEYPLDTSFAIVDTLNDPYQAASQVLASINASEYDFVVSLSERASLTASMLRSLLDLPGEKFDQVLGYTDKYIMKRRFKRAGLQTARFYLAGNVGEVINAVDMMPKQSIIKPVYSAGSDAIHVTGKHRDATFWRYIDRISSPETTSEKSFPLLVEEKLDVVSEYHCDGFVEDGEVCYARVSKYSRPVLDYSDGILGSFTLSHNDPVAANIKLMHKEAVNAVGILNGPTHFEVLGTAQGLYAGEIAGRPGGGGVRDMLMLREGFDSYKARLYSAIGMPYEFFGTESDVEVLQLMLPTRRGTISAISDASELLAIPGIVDCRMSVSVGDEVGGLLDSSSVSGIVIAKLNSTDDASRIIHDVMRVFRLEVL